ncbi:hypothetical protein GLOTRDRAFT_109003 [Gloeophyllum trabeum ATCC 11539]|uniref:Protein byr4 n=1 Tax=Gloeophyllum trabeum (strain ATCC 11539 / FP-39264 / Madison 617) TaxID=670483 RepID=S7S3Y5_GLOTA|nr:uncharacterized protein GLOTRDRAFT_109003 [Gloeophyllum trabeum ATCC 11539]EPQ60544.1 hypothetical protein GLOTRDRAFT_109003 [Gloeophyllum trabeum ATCC 11539]
MTTIPAPSGALAREEWPDADFELPDDEPLHASDAESDKDDDDLDWDNEMGLGTTGGAKAEAVIAGMAARSESRRSSTQLITIRPPLSSSEDNDEDEEGISTIKVSALPIFSKPSTQPASAPIDEDLEADFALPEELTQLSLRPQSLHHQSSKGSLEWGDQTSSSQSSDAPSTLGLAEHSSSSTYTSASLPETETEDENEEEDDGELDGLVIPAGIFESKQGGKHLAKLLELKKKKPVVEERIKIASPDPEDDFEIGLVIDDDADFSPSRMLHHAQQQQSKRTAEGRSKSAPSRPPPLQRPPSRLRSDRAKSPTNPPISSARQFSRLNIKTSPPRPGMPRAQTARNATANAPASPPSSFLTPKPGSLRGQKSQPGLKPPSPPSSQRKMTRKASLPALTDSMFQAQPPVAGPSSTKPPAATSRYEQHTAASRAKTSHNSSTGRMHGSEFKVPPTRPSTPSSNPAALRLTMPTSSSRMKSRPAISSVFPPAHTPTSQTRPTSPLPPRPHSTASTVSARARTSPSQTTKPTASAPKVLKRPKRQRTYGDGTELDNFDDLPTDRDKEMRYRVQPKGFGNRVPGGTYSKVVDGSKGTVRRKKQGSTEPGGNALRRAGRIEFPAQTASEEPATKKKRASASSPTTRRKPTLIRNLGGAGAPKVVGDMKWNPQTLRWEGNDQVLRDFDAVVGTSTRPALITHLTGSSMGSPVGSFASGARLVGNMMFDPQKMCWISTLPPEEDEPDVFADLADDEDDADGWETKGGTIRASQQGVAEQSSDASRVSTATRMSTPSPAPARSRSMSESESDRGSRASMCVADVDEIFVEECRLAEERHRAEMKGWRLDQPLRHAEPDRSYLYEIRALATRRY